MESKETRLVWITMLAMADQDGLVEASVPGLAERAKVPLADTMAALKAFMSPDQWSRSKAHEGRRIEDCEGGWFVLNHYKYQELMSAEDRRAYWALKQREARARKNAVSRRIRKRESDTMQRAMNGEGGEV